MLTIFRDSKTDQVIKETIEFEYIHNAINRKFIYRGKEYVTLKHRIDINNNKDRNITQTIHLLQMPDRALYDKGEVK